MKERERDHGVSRRTFLTSVCAGAATIAASSILVPTFASGAESGGADIDVLNTDLIYHGDKVCHLENVSPISAVTEPEQYDYETEVLILGFGVSGTSAALTLANLGIKGIAMEKSTEDHWYEHAGVHEVGVPGVKEWRDKLGIPEWNEETIKTKLPASMTLPADISKGDIETTVHLGLEELNGFEQVRALGAGCEFELVEIYPNWADKPTMIPTNDNLGGDIYTPWENKYHAVEHVISKHVQANGVQVLWGNRGTNLIVDTSGRVVGAKGQDDDGNVIYVKAKAVIDCAGGYGANYDMVLYYGMVDQMCGCHVGGLVNDGTVQRMCQGAGCGVRGLPRCPDTAEGGIDAIGLGLPWTWVHNAYPDRQISGYTYAPIQLGRQPVLKVNKYGLRFMDEDQDWAKKIWADFQQPENRFYTTFDGDIEANVAELNKRYGMCERLITPDLKVYFDDDDIRPMYKWQDEMQDGLDKGFIIQADTLEELAGKLGINVENYLATVERYNELVDKGVDEDYGKDSRFLFPIKKAPFYGFERMPAYDWNQCGGVATTMYGQVMKPNGDIIPGLYCGGNDACVTDIETYSMSSVVSSFTAGGAHFAVGMGYISAKQAVADIKA